MIGDIIIDVNNISKVYKLYNNQIDRLKETLHPIKKIYHKEFFALKNVTFQVKEGETIGIIGRNGAGKSTLLKIITGVLTPTGGRVAVNGKIASLLELGAGFNPEFTGIENVYFNGTIMGYTRKEMDARLSAILEFADIGEFIHQPVKIYSSGMYVRLAFSVAINVEPQVLIVDEALAVGDSRFQLQCYKKLEEICHKGTTIIFVTHSIETLKSFATKAILLESGQILSEGHPVDVSLDYYRLLFGDSERIDIGSDFSHKVTEDNISVTQAICEPAQAQKAEQVFFEIIPEKLSFPPKKYGQSFMGIAWIRIYGLQAGNVFTGGNELTIVISYIISPLLMLDYITKIGLKNQLVFGIRIENSKGFVLTDIATSSQDGFLPIICDEAMKSKVIEFKVQMPLLAEGDYWLSPGVAVGNLDQIAPIVEYPFLLNIRCSPREKVLGAMKFDCKIRVKE